MPAMAKMSSRRPIRVFLSVLVFLGASLVSLLHTRMTTLTAAFEDRLGLDWSGVAAVNNASFVNETERGGAGESIAHELERTKKELERTKKKLKRTRGELARLGKQKNETWIIEEKESKSNRTADLSNSSRTGDGVDVALLHQLERIGTALDPNPKQWECGYPHGYQRKNHSVIDYIANAGLGHRLARMAVPANMAYRLKAGLYSFWGCCDQTLVFDHLFGAAPFLLEQPVETEQHPVHFQVRGVERIMQRVWPSTQEEDCFCSQPQGQTKIQSDHLFYSQLLERYRHKQKLDAFMEQHAYHNHTVIGLHVRAGNGEDGHFQNTNRGIPNITSFVEIVASDLERMSATFVDPPLLFLATDTVTIVDLFRQRLASTMQVIDYPVPYRPQEGQGVNSLWTKRSGEECLDKWESALNDHFLLALSNVVVASTPSSFVHTTPLSLAAGRQNKKVPDSFCEYGKKKFNSKRSTLRCFDSVEQWCCHRTQEPVDFFALDESLSLLSQPKT